MGVTCGDIISSIKIIHKASNFDNVLLYILMMFFECFIFLYFNHFRNLIIIFTPLSIIKLAKDKNHSYYTYSFMPFLQE